MEHNGPLQSALLGYTRYLLALLGLVEGLLVQVAMGILGHFG